MELERKYGVASTLYSIPLIIFDSTKFAATGDWTPAAGDVKVRKDGGAWADIGTLPTASEQSWDFVLTAAELTAAVVQIKVVDVADDAIEDQAILIATYGNVSAQWLLDRGEAQRGTNGANTTTPPTAVQNRQEMDANSTRLDANVSTRSSHSAADVWTSTTRTLSDYGTLVADTAAAVWATAVRTVTNMRGTDGANTVIPLDATATAAAAAVGAAVAIDAALPAGESEIAAAGTTAKTLDDVTAPTVGEIDTELTANHGAGSWLEAGGGGVANPLTVTIQDTGTPAIGAKITIVDDVTGEIFIDAEYTNPAGQIVIQGKAPGDYRLTGSLAGWDIPATTITVISGPGSQTVDATIQQPSVPGSPECCLLFGNLTQIDCDPINGPVPLVGAKVLVAAQSGATPIFPAGLGVGIAAWSGVTDAAGHFEIEILKDVPITITIEAAGYLKSTTLTTATQDIKDIT